MRATIKKQDLLTGDVVFSSKSYYGIVLLYTEYGSIVKWFKNKHGEIIHKYRTFTSINDDLVFEDGSGRITKVYRPSDPHTFTTLDTIKDEYLIWEETKEMTLAEIEDILGYKIKIRG